MYVLLEYFGFEHFGLAVDKSPLGLLMHLCKSLPCIYVTRSGKKGLIAHLQVLRYDSSKFFKCCSSPMKAATCIRFSHYAASYLQYHPEYKKPATKFPAILDSFLTEVHCVSFEHHHGWRWGWWEGKGIL